MNKSRFFFFNAVVVIVILFRFRDIKKGQKVEEMIGFLSFLSAHPQLTSPEY